MKATAIYAFLFFLCLTTHGQVHFTYFNEDFEVVKERKAVYFTNQHFEKKGREAVVLTPIAGGEKYLVSFQNGSFLHKKPYEGDVDKFTPLLKDFDRDGLYYHDKEVFHEVDEPPAFEGGETALYEFLDRNLTYPPEAAKKGIQGRVFVQFIVTASGEISEVRVVKGVHPLLNAEAVRVIRAMGEQERWVPGRVKGNPVATLLIFPIAFRR